MLFYYPNVSSLIYGFDDESFVSLIRVEVMEKIHGLDVPANANFVLVYRFAQPNNHAIVTVEYYDKQLKVIGDGVFDYDYNPKQQKWYKSATEKNSLVVTEPYIAVAGSAFGMNVAVPLPAGNGVFAVTSSMSFILNIMNTSAYAKDTSFYLLDTESKAVLGKKIYERHEQFFNKYNNKIINYGDRIILAKEKNYVANSSAHTIFSEIINLYYDSKMPEAEQSFLYDGEEFYFKISSISLNNQEFQMFVVMDSSVAFRYLHESFDNVLLFTLMSILLMLPLVHVVARRVSNPLVRISAEAKAIGESHFEPSPHVNTEVMELKTLVFSIQTMKENLLEYTDYLHHNQEVLQKAVDEKTQELSDALSVATEATVAKGHFLSTMSHELRTPMNAILGFTYIFDKSNLSHDQQVQLEKIRLSSESLLHIINDILDFSKLEVGKVFLENIPFSLSELLQSTFDMTQHLAKAKGLTYSLEKDQGLPEYIIGDPNRLRQVLINLVGNAIKFTESGSVVICVRRVVRLQASSKNMDSPSQNHISLAFQIKDTGIGMTGEQMSRLFHSFSQADASISRRFGGSGLGLNISKQLITLMGGEISVQSTKGEGSEFSTYFTFDIAGDQAAKAKPTQEKKRYKEGALALVVDDNQINLEVSKALLKKFKVNTETVMSGQEALNRVQVTAYDIIFMDIQMPEMDGLTACSLIRAMADDPTAYYVTDVKNVPIIAMTANAMPEDRLNCLEAGMNEHIAKPITPSRLFEIVQEWLAIEDDTTATDDAKNNLCDNTLESTKE